jgi:hypothetical protein
MTLAACGDPPVPQSQWVVAPAAAAIRCVNTVSGAAWIIPLDPARGLADGQPASFGARHLAWGRQGEGAVFDLDRATGAFTVTRGSSTGGYVATYACRP